MWRYLDPDSFAAIRQPEAARFRARARPDRRETRNGDDRPPVTADSVLRWLREDDRRDALTPWLPDALEARRRRQSALRRPSPERTRVTARS